MIHLSQKKSCVIKEEGISSVPKLLTAIPKHNKGTIWPPNSKTVLGSYAAIHLKQDYEAYLNSDCLIMLSVFSIVVHCSQSK